MFLHQKTLFVSARTHGRLGKLECWVTGMAVSGQQYRFFHLQHERNVVMMMKPS